MTRRKRLGFKLSHARRVVQTVAEIEAGGNLGGAGDAAKGKRTALAPGGGFVSAACSGGVRGCGVEAGVYSIHISDAAADSSSTFRNGEGEGANKHLGNALAAACRSDVNPRAFPVRRGAGKRPK